MYGAGAVPKRGVLKGMLHSLTEVADPTSLEGQLHYSAESMYGKRNKQLRWHDEAQMHGWLGEYLAKEFPHGSLKEPAAIESASLMFDMLDAKLCPWRPKNFSSSLEWKRSFQGRGLVTSVPAKYLTIALTGIQGLRSTLGADLPVKVYYADDRDLPMENRRALEKIDNVTVCNLSEVYPIQLRGFQVKPFAMLASGFAEVIWFDADLLFLVNPEVLLDNEDYHETGTVFFHDRTLSGWGSVEGASIDWPWIQGIIGRGSEYLRSSPAFVGRASNIMDSSAVVMHMTRNFFVMLVVAQLNLNSDTYTHVWGDKETFWLGFEILRKPWAMNRWGMSGVTFMHRNDSECTGDETWNKAVGADLPACGHMGPRDIVHMIHFSESKTRGPAPFTVPPTGFVPDVNKSWYATCVRFEADELKEFRASQMELFRKYIRIHMQHTV